MGGIQLVGSFKWEMMKGRSATSYASNRPKDDEITFYSLVADNGRFAQP